VKGVSAEWRGGRDCRSCWERKTDAVLPLLEFARPDPAHGVFSSLHGFPGSTRQGTTAGVRGLSSAGTPRNARTAARGSPLDVLYLGGNCSNGGT
jgi:hypothetical protein